MADATVQEVGWQQQNQEQQQSQIPWASHAALTAQPGTASPTNGSSTSGVTTAGLTPMTAEPAPSSFIVRTRGLPYEATKNEVIQFLSDCKVKNEKDGVHMLVGPDGRPTGEALVELEAQQDFESALKHDHQNLGRRYVEVMAISKEQMDMELSRQPGTYGSGDCVVRLRGLPWAATSKDVLDLLKDCQVMNGEKGVHFTFAPDGRPSGEAFVELCAEEDVSNALNHNNEHMGRRYVEIFRASRGQMAWDCRMEEKVGGGSGGVVRLRGLPYRCSEDDVRKFFQGMLILAGGITMQVDQSGRETGEAFVEFVDQEDAEKALAKDRQEIGHRYIEVFRSTHAEIRPVRGAPPPSRPTPYDRPGGSRGGYGGYNAKYSGYERPYRGRGRGGGPVPVSYPPYDPYGGAAGGGGGGGGGGYYEQEYYGTGYESGYPPPPPGTGDQSLVAYPPIRPSQPARGGFGAPKEKHSIRMRGLPFSAKDKDIMEFFAPLVPARVNIDFDHYGRPSGEAEVQFGSHEDAMSAMQKNNAHMGHRYIELFLNSRDDMGAGQPAPPPPARVGGGPIGPGAGPPRYQAPPPQQPQPGWSDPRMQGRTMGSDMGQQQQGMYDTSGGGYGQQQQYVGMQQQYGGTQVATAPQPQQQQYAAMTQQATGYGGGYDQNQQVTYQQQPSYQQQPQQQQQWY